MPTGSDNARIISEQYLVWVEVLVTNATSTLIVYDWLLNLDEEIKFFWNCKVTAATVLYCAIRYLVIVYWAMCYQNRVPGTGCDVYMYIIYVLQLLLYISPAVFSTLRVYALTCQNKIVTLITLFFSLGPVYANAIHYGWERPGHYDSGLDCLILDSATRQMGIMFTVISRGLLSVGDLLVIGITVVKTIYVAKYDQGIIGPTSLARTLLYSGVIYYTPLAILNVAHMSMTVTGADQFLRTTSIVSIFIDPITSVLACRFLLNLRKVEECHRGTARTASETMQFTPGAAQDLPAFISSMGELFDIDFSNPEASSMDGLEDLDIITTELHVSNSANLPRESVTLEPPGEDSQIDSTGNTTDVAPPTSSVV